MWQTPVQQTVVDAETASGHSSGPRTVRVPDQTGPEPKGEDVRLMDTDHVTGSLWSEESSA